MKNFLALVLFDAFPEAKQILVLRALGDRKDDASKKLVFPKAVALAKDGSVALKTAAAKALINVGSVDAVAAFDPFEAEDFDDKELGDATRYFRNRRGYHRSRLLHRRTAPGNQGCGPHRRS